MRNITTDLAVEHPSLQQDTPLPGITVRTQSQAGCELTHIEITDETGARALGKPQGTYISLDLPPRLQRTPQSDRESISMLAEQLRALLPAPGRTQPLLAAGLGNARITPDAIGPQTVERLLVTRHMLENMPGETPREVNSLCAIAPGVLGTTGMETAEVICGIVQRIRPYAVIVIDALAAVDSDRINRTVQLSNTGIAPGSGLGNHRQTIDARTLGVPVIAVGVPTVVYAHTILADVLERIRPVTDDWEQLEARILDAAARHMEQLVVTPRDIDIAVSDLSGIIAGAINRAVHPHASEETLEQLLF